MEMFSKDFFKGYFSRNKKYFLISLSIFAFCFIFGAVVNFIAVGSHYGELSAGLRNMSGITVSDFGMDGLELFLHNIKVDIITIIGGLFFSIISLIVFFVNAFSIATPFGSDFTFAFVGIVPHGIFEYFASVIALVAAFLITRVEINLIKSLRDKELTVRDVLSDSRPEILDIVFSIILDLVLLVIAALIEANITPRIMLWFYGIH